MENVLFFLSIGLGSGESVFPKLHPQIFEWNEKVVLELWTVKDLNESNKLR